MLARSALARLAADVPKASTHDLSRSARFIQRRLFSRRHLLSPSSPLACSRVYCAALLDAHRTYATAADATQPTRKVKQDVKRAAAEKPAAKKPVTKKPVTKKPASKKPAAPKTAPKKKAAKPKKKLTPEQAQKAKETKQKNKDKLLIHEAKAKALEPPASAYKRNAWHLVAAEMLHAPGKDADKKKLLLDAGAKFKALTPAEKEHYNHLANESNAARAAELEAWIQSHTPEEIRLANKARTWLKRRLSRTAARKYFKLKDDRYLKRPHSAYTHFVKERSRSGDMKGIPPKDMMKLCANEWKALSASEKQKYQDESNVRKAEYEAEFEQRYGRAPGPSATSP